MVHLSPESKSECFSRPIVQGVSDSIEYIFIMKAKICALWKVLAQQAVCALVAAALPRNLHFESEVGSALNLLLEF